MHLEDSQVGGRAVGTWVAVKVVGGCAGVVPGVKGRTGALQVVIVRRDELRVIAERVVVAFDALGSIEPAVVVCGYL